MKYTTDVFPEAAQLKAPTGKWTLVVAPNPRASIRLFCFPYAGSGASTFRDWPSLLSPDVEVAGIQLPGRENRFTEPRIKRLQDVLPILAEVIRAQADLPFMFFGHSLGALIAFELTRLLRRGGLPSPFHLVVSGMRAPHVAGREAPLHLLEEAAFLEKISDFNGTPPDLLRNAELMQLLLPQLRDDFAIYETYHCNDSTPVQCPLTVLGGDADVDISAEDLAAWSTYAGSRFECQMFPGDHFFIHPNKARLLCLLRGLAISELQLQTNMQAQGGPGFAETWT